MSHKHVTVSIAAVRAETLRTGSSRSRDASPHRGLHPRPHVRRQAGSMCDKKASFAALQPTMKAPYWEGMAVVNGEFKKIKSTDYEGKYLVLFFYPLDFTFVCPTEIIAFSDRIEEFKKIKTEVVACSVDSHFSHLAWTKLPRTEGGLGPMNIPLLSDLTHDIGKAFNVYLEKEGVSLRGLFIVDPKGVLRQMTVNDLPVGRSVDETLRLVQAFQFTDEHGEVCPAGWKPGKKAMKPTKEGVSSYLATHEAEK